MTWTYVSILKSFATKLEAMEIGEKVESTNTTFTNINLKNTVEIEGLKMLL